jgi:putative addiction module CopG family antidote
MNITLTKELERVLEDQVNSGQYESTSEAVRDAVRRTFCPTLDLERDTPELAALLRESMNSPHIPHEKGDCRRLLEKVRRELGR